MYSEYPKLAVLSSHEQKKAEPEVPQLIPDLKTKPHH